MDIGEIVQLKVVDITHFGYFLDWGQDDDILLPNTESYSEKMVGDTVLVMICHDEIKDRYYVTERIEDKLIKTVNPGLFNKGDRVTGIVYATSPLGYKVCFNQHYTGILYRNEVFRDIKVGDKLELFVKTVREDGKIDLSIAKQGYRNVIDNNTEIILNSLKENNGVLELGDKSSPEDIYKTLGMSKKNFKEAIGRLFKVKKIEIRSNGISLK